VKSRKRQEGGIERRGETVPSRSKRGGLGKPSEKLWKEWGGGSDGTSREGKESWARNWKVVYCPGKELSGIRLTCRRRREAKNRTALIRPLRPGGTRKKLQREEKWDDENVAFLSDCRIRGTS